MCHGRMGESYRKTVNRSSRILDFSLSEQFCQRSLRTKGLELKAPSANERFYAITVFTKATSHKVFHYTGQQALSWSVSSPQDEGEGNMAWTYCHRQPYTAKRALAVRHILWHFRIICGDVNTCWGKRTILVPWPSCDSKPEARAQWGGQNAVLGLTIAFLLRSTGLYLNPYVADLAEPKWNQDLSKPFTWKKRRSYFLVHRERRGNDMIWITNRRNDNSNSCLSPRHCLYVVSFNPGNNLIRQTQLAPLYRWRNWRFAKSNNFAKCHTASEIIELWFEPTGLLLRHRSTFQYNAIQNTPLFQAHSYMLHYKYPQSRNTVVLIQYVKEYERILGEQIVSPHPHPTFVRYLQCF